MAACPNVYVKLGGIGMPRTGFDWHARDKPIGSEELAASMAPFMTYCIEQFGPDPLHVREQLPGRQGLVLVQRAVQRLQAALEGYSASERAAMFHDTAARVYRVAV